MEDPALSAVPRPSPEDRFARPQRIDRLAGWRDKIEVRLDNRQVFFLFFGSAVVACMLFVLGVIVGKRIESRGRAAAAEVSDPLAVLDRATQPAAAPGAVPGDDLTFPQTLIGGPKGRAPKPAPAAAVRPPAAPPKPLAVAAPPSAPKVIAPATAPPAPVAAKPPVPIDPSKAPRGKYTLQLGGTMATKEEAEAFARKFSAQGAFVVAVDVPEKGKVYRVRCGNYPTFADAAAAKTTFEKTNKTIALVAAR